ncbi:Uncharacterized protein BP5553_01694 [Venustampulla echinocandica]|uniref:MARVEL domain-containing protein n=1 Tax=Venustampulla echinocandica TaxID=2656787 RepID=A0A370U1S5_9HELO|nr:Uncharacterized protein BP5553_01694 [Venustampulla echinocandica]RDL41715.1 Uncharacterized protein BP5553_01694 [Venustampulla echinocandica]
MAIFEVLMLPFRIAQGVLSIIILGLTAYVINSWNGILWWESPSQVNFLLFCSLWTLLALVYLVLAPMRFQAAAHKYAILAAEAVTMIFWFAGFIALAVLLGDIRCGRWGGVCRASQAATVFGAFEWLLFTATTVAAALHAFGLGSSRTKQHDPAIQVQPQV